MPVSFASFFRVAVLMLLSVHVFYMYSLARTMHATVGFDLGTSIVAAMFSLVMLVPLVWAVTLPELPEIYTRHVRARRWHRAGRCHACGYQIASDEPVCAECGSTVGKPVSYAVSVRTVRMFVVINLLAWALGSAAGELWSIDDERQFAREVERQIEKGKLGSYIRPRRWPSQSQRLEFDAEYGIRAR